MTASYAVAEWRGRLWMAALYMHGQGPFRLLGGSITVVTPSLFDLIARHGRVMAITCPERTTVTAACP